MGDRMPVERYEGAWTALVTPLQPDGALDAPGLRKNIEFQIAQGIAGILATGTTGESPTLIWDEHNAVIEQCVEFAKGRCGVLAGTGSNSTAEALKGSEHAAEIGADGVLLVDCYYNGPSSLELRREYHGAIAAACPNVDVIPYVIPGRTGCALSAEDVAVLAAEFPNVKAVKEATGDLERMARTRELAGPEFMILSGDDNLTCEMMLSPEIRASGVISVMSNVVPGAIDQMTRAALQGNADEARRLHEVLTPLFDLVTILAENERRLPGDRSVKVRDKFRNPLGVKTLMNGLGLPAGPCRRPLGKMTRNAVETVRHVARRMLQDHPEVLLPIEAHFGVGLAARLEQDDHWAPLAYS